jgi:hypothetical protein
VKGNRLLGGINSKGNIRYTNYNLRLEIKESIDMLKEFAKKHSVEICGVNKTCLKP